MRPEVFIDGGRQRNGERKGGELKKRGIKRKVKGKERQIER